jgi:hypothetical protein
MPYGDLLGGTVLLAISNGRAANIHSACCCHASCSPCTSAHPTLHLQDKGLASRPGSGFPETHISRASDFSQPQMFDGFSGKKTASLKNHMTSVELGNIRLGLATKKTDTDSVD